MKLCEPPERFALSFVFDMPAMKRPVAGPSMRKPAASSGINETIRELKKETALADDAPEENGNRDKGKAEKFSKMLRAGTLPPHIANMWEIQAKSAEIGERAFKTKLVNSLFKRQADGTLKVDTDQHFFEEYRSIYETHLAKDKRKSLPRGIMLATHFGGNERLMQSSLDKGELEVTYDGNMEFLSFRELTVADIRGNESREKVQGNKKLKQEEAYELAGLMSKLKWSFNMSKAGLHSPTAIHGHYTSFVSLIQGLHE